MRCVFGALFLQSGKSPVDVERAVLIEFGRCLEQIISSSESGKRHFLLLLSIYFNFIFSSFLLSQLTNHHIKNQYQEECNDLINQDIYVYMLLFIIIIISVQHDSIIIAAIT